MERLTMRDISEIIYRLRKGQSERAIAVDMKRHRGTVHLYRAFAEQQGYLEPSTVLPSEEQLLREFGPPVAPPRIPSSVDPFAALVEQWVKDDVEMRAMHRLLCEEHGFTGSYSAVRRFIAARHPVSQEVFVRIETGPGEEAQVDFGTVGKLFDTLTGKMRSAYCFVMTLSHSRHMYVEFVFDQKIATWVGCHRRAFAYFGGVVERVVVDNLKAAVLVHDLEDPILCIPYKRMAQHYGFLISPCRPYTPQHKGKVESGVRYVKGNLWPGLKERKVSDANAGAMKWIENHAGLRIHGTTRKQPIVQFRQVEQQRLAPLPEHPFELMTVREAGVRIDQHLCAENSYYSAPREYVGRKLEVYLFEKTVQLYDGVKLVFTHPRAAEPGTWVTHPGHKPEHKANYLQLTPEKCLERAKEVGPSCHELIEAMLTDRPKDKRRAMAALIGLAGKYGEHRLEAACRCAIAWQDPRYTRVKHTLLNDLDDAVVADDAHSAVETVHPRYRYARSTEEFFHDTTPARREAVAC
jgi:transposase